MKASGVGAGLVAKTVHPEALDELIFTMNASGVGAGLMAKNSGP